MMHLHADLIDTMVRDHIERLTPSPSTQPTGALRRLIGISLIRFGAWVGGQRIPATLPAASGELVTR